MKISILTILFLSINSVFGQNKSVGYNEIIPEYIISIWENNKTSSDSKFDSTDLNETKTFFSELSKRENAITSNQFLKKPSDNTLVANYLNTKLKWNSFNGPHVGLKKESTKKVVENSLKKLPQSIRKLFRTCHLNFMLWLPMANLNRATIM